MTRHTQGQPPPGTNDDARWQAGTEGKQGTTDAGIVADLDAERKTFATQQAQAALAGAGLHKLESGYLLCRWGLTRELATLDDVHGLLDRMGAP